MEQHLWRAGQDGPCQASVSEDTTELYIGTDSSNPVPRRCHAADAAISDSAPGPVWISVEVTSGGHDMKSMPVTLIPPIKAKQIRVD